jgi:histone-lysine N-methyltransferase SETD2
LPPNWKTAKDGEGKVYYYHAATRQTQWEPPTWDVGSGADEDDMDLGTPSYDDTKVTSHKRSSSTTTTAAADTSTEVAKRLKDQFRSQIAQHIVACLGPYRRPDCEQGRINTTEDFKRLARKLTHAVLSKELKHCRHFEDLEVNENVKGKAKDYVTKYMSKFPGMYRPSNYSP